MADHLKNTHFGADLKAYIIHQYYHCSVTQPLILSSLRDFGVDISSGQISAILTENKEAFHREKTTLLSKGIELTDVPMIQEQGISSKMGFVTALITTFSKSRINFLEILRHQRSDYHINEASLSYVDKDCRLGIVKYSNKAMRKDGEYLRTKKPLNTIIKQKEYKAYNRSSPLFIHSLCRKKTCRIKILQPCSTKTIGLL